MAFTTPVDVVNRGLQHLGVPRITTLTDSSKPAREANFVFDKVRRSELQRSVWTFAVRHAVMRKIVSTTDNVTFATWAIGTTYAVGDIIADSAGYLWMSVRATNLAQVQGAGGINPYWIPYFGPTTAQVYSASVNYYPGDIIYTSSVVYIAVAASLNQAQAANTAYWHVIAGATIAANTTTTISPMGYKPDGSAVRGIYRLPANFLRMAAQDPKSAAGVQLNVTAAMRYNDWEVEAGHLMTNDTDGFIMRFVADQTDMTVMDDLFCEVWAARIAIALCDTLTQSTERLNNVRALYTGYINMAKFVNEIEGGSSEDDPTETDVPQQQGATAPRGR
jgi:hypothetical protein